MDIIFKVLTLSIKITKMQPLNIEKRLHLYPNRQNQNGRHFF